MESARLTDYIHWEYRAICTLNGTWIFFLASIALFYDFVSLCFDILNQILNVDGCAEQSCCCS